MNFSFGTPTTTTASTGGFSLGAPATSTATAGFSFGTTPTFGATGASAPAPTLSLNPTAATTTTPAPGGLGTLSFGASLGNAGTAATASSAATAAQPTAAALPTFGSLGAGTPQLGAGATTTSLALPTANQPAGGSTPGINLLGGSMAQPATTTTAAAPLTLGGFGLSKPAEQNTLSLGATTTVTTAPASTTNTAATTTGASSGLAASLTTNTQTTQSATVAGNQQLKFFQLEEFINKWTLELEEQEKLFTNQATQVNAWDNMLLANGEKIVALNKAVMKVKAEQNAMEQELEFITAQHTELEECIVPLEQELSRIGQIDLERGQTYSMAETLDSQLKQMYEDLKEVIEHLNDANKYTDPNDPLVQIGKILNAHMNSLQWIETSTTSITNRLEEINKMHETLRKDNERSFRLTYYDQ
ncbi:nuclear pore glycoprotein p62 [Anopheles maculipalpis]|uniref:nuclear pore glycoprotein p62 n=1 Tax=Anopheles maculipalpis TaxID=1496333 RepID=UPI002159070B|nr:nuclear pore glycoprotein p62 [Anopheles maculipalpis]